MLASLVADPLESDPCMPEFPSSSRALEVERPDKPLKSSLYCSLLIPTRMMIVRWSRCDRKNDANKLSGEEEEKNCCFSLQKKSRKSLKFNSAVKNLKKKRFCGQRHTCVK